MKTKTLVYVGLVSIALWMVVLVIPYFSFYQYLDPKPQNVVYPRGWTFIFSYIDELLYDLGIFAFWELAFFFGSLCILLAIIMHCRKPWQQMMVLIFASIVVRFLLLESDRWMNHVMEILE